MQQIIGSESLMPGDFGITGSLLFYYPSLRKTTSFCSRSRCSVFNSGALWKFSVLKCLSKHIKNQLLFFAEQAARLKKMEEEEKRKKAEFRKKVRPSSVLSKTKWICDAELFWPPFINPAIYHMHLLFRWRKRCRISSKTVHNRKENTIPWGRLKGVYCTYYFSFVTKK